MSLSTGAHCKIGPSSSLDLSRGLDAEENRAVLDTDPECLHLDISDERFFSPVSFGSEMVQALRERLPNTFLDVHLMVEDPDKWVDEIASAGASQFTFHIETTESPSDLIRHIKDKGMKVGIAFKPATPVEYVLPHVDNVDMILVMTTEPGVKGQEVVNNALHKVETLQKERPGLLIKTDGWDEPSREQVSMSNNQESKSNESSPALEQRSQVTTTATSCHPDPSSAIKIKHNHHTTSYGTLSTNGSQCGCDERDCDASMSESQPLLTTQSSKHDGSVQCECHVTVEDDTARRAKLKLVAASVIALLFMIGEVLGGYFAGSLAIMTDAAHMLSDFAGFLISLFAIWLASRPSSNRMSFGWHRAEVVGAVVSVLIIWVITGVLFYEAVLRVAYPERFEINADIMLITACVGVYVNVFMCGVLHPHSHNHGHGHSHGKDKGQENSAEKGSINFSLNDFSSQKSGQKQRFWERIRRKKYTKHSSEENINVRAAFIHVIGDLIQSIGVVIAGYIIKFKPEWKIADPICTFIFCVLVLISTLNVLKDALRVLMEATPKHINYEEVKRDLSSIPGVRTAHSLHIWSLTLNKTALAAHLVLETDANHQDVLNEASKMLRREHNITSTTLQVENHHHAMEDCDTCQENTRSRFCCPL